MTARTVSLRQHGSIALDTLEEWLEADLLGDDEMHDDGERALADLRALLDTLARVTEERDALRKFIGSRVWPNLDHASAAISGDEWSNGSLAVMEVAEQLADIAMECRAALREGGAQ